MILNCIFIYCFQQTPFFFKFFFSFLYIVSLFNKQFLIIFEFFKFLFVLCLILSRFGFNLFFCIKCAVQNKEKQNDEDDVKK